MSIPLSKSVGDVICVPVIHPVQIAADVANTVHKVYPGVVGRIVAIQAIPGIQGGTTVVTDLDITAYKSGTTLNSTPIAAVNSSTAATGATLTATISASATVAKLAVTDYLSVKYDVTGGNSPTIDGAGILVYVARE